MAIRNDVIIDWSVNPRIILVEAPSTEITMQDLYDTVRFKEASQIAMDNKPIIDGSGKEKLDSVTKVGLTISLLDARLGFEARVDWTQCVISGGNLVAYDGVEVVARQNTANPIHPTAFVNIDRASSSSGTLQEQEALQYASFGGEVSVDIESSTSGTIFPSGTQEFPVNNIQDAVLVAKERGFNVLWIRGDLTLGVGDNVDGFNLHGSSHVTSTLIVESEASCFETSFSDFDMSGVLDGDSEINDCVLGDITYFNGHIHNCSFKGKITLSGNKDAYIKNCSMTNISIIPEIDSGGSGQNLVMTNWSGRILLSGISGGNSVALGCDSGEVYIDNTNTLGVVGLSGSGSLIQDDSSTGCYVVDKLIDGSELSNLKTIIENLRDSHKATGNIWYLDTVNGSDTNYGDHEDRAFKTFYKAHDACVDNNHDQIIVLSRDPSGKTTITEQFNITKNGVKVRGSGRDVELIQNTLDGAINISARDVEVSGFEIRHTTQNTYAINSTGEYTLVKDVLFYECENGLVMNGQQPKVHNCKFHTTRGNSLKVEGFISHTEIYNCTFGTSGGNAIEINTSTGSGGVKMRDCVIVGAGGYGVNISPTTFRFISETGNVVEHCALGSFNNQGNQSVLNIEGALEDIADAVWNKTL